MILLLRVVRHTFGFGLFECLPHSHRLFYVILFLTCRTLSKRSTQKSWRCKTFGFGAFEAPKWVKDLSPFPGSMTHLGASRRLLGQKYIKVRSILGHILTFFDPPCQPGQFFLVQNSLYRCPTYSTTCFMLNSHLLGVF